jgi:hypothetical protein
MENLLEQFWVTRALYDTSREPHERCPRYSDCLKSVPPGGRGDDPRLVMQPFGFMGERMDEAQERIVLVGLNCNSGHRTTHPSQDFWRQIIADGAAAYRAQQAKFLGTLVPFLRYALRLPTTSEPEEVFAHVALINIVKCSPSVKGSRHTGTTILAHCRQEGYARTELEYICKRLQPKQPIAVLCLHADAYAALVATLLDKAHPPGTTAHATLDGSTLDLLKVWHPSWTWSAATRWRSALCLPPAPPIKAWDTEPLFRRDRNARAYSELLLRVWRLRSVAVRIGANVVP